MIKRCPGCGEVKPLDDFHRHKSHKRKADGRTTRCKVCRRAQNRAWERANPEKKAAANRKWWRKNPEKVAAYADKRRKRWPEKTKACQALRNAVRRGRVVKPAVCEGCGSHVEDPADLHGHHHDYSKPLEVEWLCGACHTDAHRAEDHYATR